MTLLLLNKPVEYVYVLSFGYKPFIINAHSAYRFHLNSFIKSGSPCATVSLYYIVFLMQVSFLMIKLILNSLQPIAN